MINLAKKKKSATKKSNRTCNRKPNCGYNKFITPDGKQCVEIKYIGKGSFGCVISPPIIDSRYVLKTLVPYTNRNNNDVAKLFFKDRDFNDELKYSKIMQKIDPENKFTVKVNGAHKISSECMKFSDSIMYCLKRKINDISKAKFNQIIMENGGLPLNTHIYYTISYAEFLEMFKNFISGMISLQQNNIVHRDIKPHNVLIDDKKKTIKLIDFGLMCQHYRELYDGKDENMIFLRGAIDYVYYPPEFYVAYLMLKYRHYYENDIVTFHKFIDTLYEKMEERGFFTQEKLRIDSILKLEYQYGINSFLQTIRNSGFTKCSDIFTREIAMKADVFSVASLIVSLSSNIRYNAKSEQKFIDYIYQKCIRANPYERVTFSELYSIISTEQLRSSSKSDVAFTNDSNMLKLMKSYDNNKYQPMQYAGKRTLSSRNSKERKTIMMNMHILPFMALSVSKMKNIYNRHHPSPKKYNSKLDIFSNISR